MINIDVEQVEKTSELRRYLTVVNKFLQYLKDTEKMKFRLSAEYFGDNGCEEVATEIPYLHRWKTQYKNGVLWKFYQLEAWLKEHPVDAVTMVTLTTQHGYNKFHKKSKFSDRSIERSFEILKEGWYKLARKFRPYSYIWIMEPHQNGYPHLHVAVFGSLSENERYEIKKLWVKWKIGSYENGVNFEEKQKNDSVKSVRNYLMKYMRKTIYNTESKFLDKAQWTAGELVFNALSWKHKWRFWDSSADLKKIMKFTRSNETDPWHYVSTELKNKDGDYIEIWSKKGFMPHLGIYTDESDDGLEPIV